MLDTYLQRLAFANGAPDLMRFDQKGKPTVNLKEFLISIADIVMKRIKADPTSMQYGFWFSLSQGKTFNKLSKYVIPSASKAVDFIALLYNVDSLLNFWDSIGYISKRVVVTSFVRNSSTHDAGEYNPKSQHFTGHAIDVSLDPKLWTNKAPKTITVRGVTIEKGTTLDKATARYLKDVVGIKKDYVVTDTSFLSGKASFVVPLSFDEVFLEHVEDSGNTCLHYALGITYTDQVGDSSDSGKLTKKRMHQTGAFRSACKQDASVYDKNYYKEDVNTREVTPAEYKFYSDEYEDILDQITSESKSYLLIMRSNQPLVDLMNYDEITQYMAFVERYPSSGKVEPVGVDDAILDYGFAVLKFAALWLGEEVKSLVKDSGRNYEKNLFSIYLASNLDQYYA